MEGLNWVVVACLLAVKVYWPAMPQAEEQSASWPGIRQSSQSLAVRQAEPVGGTRAVQVPLDVIIVPATGSIVQSAITLTQGVHYMAVVTGTYRYNVGEPGEFADAQYREDHHDEWTIRWNSVEFNGVGLDAAKLDRAAHRYVFFVAGNGEWLTLRIYDQPGTYGDNAGSLTVELYPTHSVFLPIMNQ